jgi:hypothetical protein
MATADGGRLVVHLASLWHIGISSAKAHLTVGQWPAQRKYEIAPDRCFDAIGTDIFPRWTRDRARPIPYAAGMRERAAPVSRRSGSLRWSAPPAVLRSIRSIPRCRK